MTSTRELVASRYMERFRCIADQCEDLCCGNWRVAMDKPCYDRIQQAMSKTEEDQQRFREALILNTEENASSHAYFRLREEDGCCPLLETDRLCGLQKRYGEPTLSDVCADFPRVVVRYGSRIELHGWTACPEVTRLILLAEDAVEQVPITSEVLPRQLRQSFVDTDPGYVRCAPEIRAAAVRILSWRHLPPGSRLVLLGLMAKELRPFVFEGTTELDGERRADGEARLVQVLKLFEDLNGEAYEAMKRDFVWMSIPQKGYARVCYDHLKKAMEPEPLKPPPPRFRALGNQVVEYYSQGEPWYLYVERRDLLDTFFGERCQQYFDNYALSWFSSNLHYKQKDVQEHVLKFATLLRTFRFMLAGHPEVGALLSRLVGQGLKSPQQVPLEERDVLDRAAVETLQVISKYYGGLTMKVSDERSMYIRMLCNAVFY